MDLNPSKSSGIICRELTFAYGDGTPVLHHVQLQIQPGEKVGIIGPNGAGKSTMLTLLAGLRSGKGVLTIDGESSSQNLCERVGLVFQNPDNQLFCQSIYDDVAFGPRNLGLKPDAVDSRVRQALQTVGLTISPKQASWQLSFGERKLAAIACILAMQPRYLAVDEPTSNLDPGHRRQLINWLQKSEESLIITTHDLDMLIGTCERVIVLDKGQICADGPAISILEDKQLLSTHGLELPLCLQHPQWNINK